MGKLHTYTAKVTWTGNQGQGTENYHSYTREHLFSIKNKPDLLCSSDPTFKGDPTKHNPEDMLVYALSACHMLWYLHLCAKEGVKVLDYSDEAKGVMIESQDRGGRFKEVILNPKVRVFTSSMLEKAKSLHDSANELCFIANSVNFPVHHHPVVSVEK